MKYISEALQAHLNGELSTLAECVKIERRDGVVKAFTTHDKDLTIDGVVYKADGAFTPSALRHEASLKENGFEVAGYLDGLDLTDDDIRAGLYDHARIEAFIVNWAEPEQGRVTVKYGWLGEVTLSNGRYVAELRGLRDLLSRQVGDAYTPECRHDFGSASCGVNASAWTVTGSVSGVVSRSAFTDTSRTKATGHFNYGKITWITGANAGLSGEVKSWDLSSKTLTLWLPMPYVIETGDVFALCAGCDKRFSTCKAKFANVPGFGGFPHLPGLDKILQYPDSK